MSEKRFDTIMMTREVDKDVPFPNDLKDIDATGWLCSTGCFRFDSDEENITKIMILQCKDITKQHIESLKGNKKGEK